MSHAPLSQGCNCADARMLFALLLYGELSFDEEERVDSHLAGCVDCRAALEREKSLHAAGDGVAVGPAASLLREFRTELRASLVCQEAPRKAPTGWWDQFVNM